MSADQTAHWPAEDASQIRAFVRDICSFSCGCEPVAIGNKVCVHCKGQLVVLVSAGGKPMSEGASQACGSWASVSEDGGHDDEGRMHVQT